MRHKCHRKYPQRSLQYLWLPCTTDFTENNNFAPCNPCGLPILQNLKISLVYKSCKNFLHNPCTTYLTKSCNMCGLRIRPNLAISVAHRFCRNLRYPCVTHFPQVPTSLRAISVAYPFCRILRYPWRPKFANKNMQKQCAAKMQQTLAIHVAYKCTKTLQYHFLPIFCKNLQYPCATDFAESTHFAPLDFSSLLPSSFRFPLLNILGAHILVPPAH